MHPITYVHGVVVHSVYLSYTSIEFLIFNLNRSIDKSLHQLQVDGRAD